jgi:hypothetical protein
MRHKQLVFVLAMTAAAAALDSGCVARAQMGASADAQPVVFTERPTLVLVESGVWVVRDYDYAVYYVDGAYWVFRDDVWYRSPTYDHGWVVAEVSLVPGVIVHRDHHAYVHFHGGAKVETRMAPGEHEGTEARERNEQRHDDKQNAGEAKQAEKKEERAERRDDNRADKKADKKQDKQDKAGKKDKDDKKK